MKTKAFLSESNLPNLPPGIIKYMNNGACICVHTIYMNIYIYITYDKKFSILSMLTLALTLRVSCVPSGHVTC